MVRLGMMIPLRRCGSNAIRLRIAQNPEVFCPYPVHLIDLDEKVYGDLTNDLNYFRLVVDVVRLQTNSLVPWEGVGIFDPHEIFQSVREKTPRGKTMVYAELLVRAGKQRKAQFVMDKSQDSVCDWRTWVSIFPDIKFLDVVRDPRAQISSMNDAVIYDYETCLNLQRWLKARQVVEEIRLEYPSNVMTVRFEDFILDEMNTIKKICDFFEIGFKRPIIQDSEEGMKMAHRSPLWESNFSEPNPLILKKYQMKLSIKEIEHIEANTFLFMKKFGYQRETLARNLLEFSKEEIQMKNQEKKDRVWKDLKETHPFDFVLREKRKLFIQNCCH